MMNFLKNFYKDRTFFLSLYLISQIFLTDFCLAQNTDERKILLLVGTMVISEPFMESASVTHTKNEPLLFAFLQKKFTANIQNPLVKENFFVWILFSTIIIAALAGYLYGKRKGMKMALAKEYTVSVTAPVVLNENDKYEDMAEKEKPFIQKYDMVTVLFADIKDFSEITDSLDPETLLDELNSFFFYFDTIIDRYHIEKIKTMGDAYMCAGGIPQKNHTNPVDVVLAALDVQNHLNRLSEKKLNVWTVRIGIHTGQVVAGMLGHKKLSYDIWGHTVNVASRLESSCEAGKINISGATFEKVERYFDCEYQGRLSDTHDLSYFVNGLKPEFVEMNSAGQLVPNHDFFVQMQLLRLGDLEEYVQSMMTDTSSNLFFHNFKHTWDVYEQVELLAHSENLKDEDVLLLKTAALLHDIGYAIAYQDDIQILSDDMARESLPIFHYKPQQINRICQLMKATHYESIPNGIMEEIMHDANLMYFGRTDYLAQTMCLFREQEKLNIPVNKTQWLTDQIRLLTKHQFYTHAAIEMVKVPVEQQIDKILQINAS